MIIIIPLVASDEASPNPALKPTSNEEIDRAIYG